MGQHDKQNLVFRQLEFSDFWPKFFKFCCPEFEICGFLAKIADRTEAEKNATNRRLPRRSDLFSRFFALFSKVSKSNDSESESFDFVLSKVSKSNDSESESFEKTPQLWYLTQLVSAICMVGRPAGRVEIQNTNEIEIVSIQRRETEKGFFGKKTRKSIFGWWVKKIHCTHYRI